MNSQHSQQCEHCGYPIERGTTFEQFVKLSNDVPVLDISLGAGTTDYIDFIRLDEVTRSVMRGTDMYRRPFVVLKVHDMKGNTLIETFFQRYTDDPYLWMGCGHATNLFVSTYGGMTSCQFHLIADLIANGTVTMKACHKPDYGVQVGDTLCLVLE